VSTFSSSAFFFRRDRSSPLKKNADLGVLLIENADRFTRIDLDLSDFEKERTHCRVVGRGRHRVLFYAFFQAKCLLSSTMNVLVLIDCLVLYAALLVSSAAALPVCQKASVM